MDNAAFDDQDAWLFSDCRHCDRMDGVRGNYDRRDGVAFDLDTRRAGRDQLRKGMLKTKSFTSMTHYGVPARTQRGSVE